MTPTPCTHRDHRPTKSDSSSSLIYLIGGGTLMVLGILIHTLSGGGEAAFILGALYMLVGVCADRLEGWL